MTPTNHNAQTTAVPASYCISDFYPLPDHCLKGQYLTKRILERIRSYETEDFTFNRALSDTYLKRLSPAAKLPVVMAFVHRQYHGPYDSVIRVVVMMPKHGRPTTKARDLVEGIVDMPWGDWDRLPLSPSKKRHAA